MPVSPDEFPAEALADVAFLARSENRVAVLAALTETSANRRDLEDATGIARATVGRALADLEDRGWVTETAGREYETTPSGERILAEFTPLLEAVEAIRRLGDRVAWLPTDEVSIGLRHFNDASILRPQAADPLAPAMSLTGLLEDAAEFHCLVGVAPPLGFEQSMRDGVVEGSLLTRHVITAEELAYLREQPERVERWREYLAAGANVYRYDGEIPCNLLIFDGTVVVSPVPAGRGPTGLVESENDAVLEWAHGVIDRYLRESTRLDATAFDRDPGTDADDG